MENHNDIEKISRGIYLLPNAFEDSYFSFQQKYKNVTKLSDYAKRMGISEKIMKIVGVYYE